MPQSCVMIACTRRAGAGSTRDCRFSFPKDPHRRALWIATVQQKDLEPKTKQTIVSVAVSFSGKPFSDESQPDFTPAARLAGHLGQFKRSVGQFRIENHRRPWYRSASTYYPPKFIFKTSRLSNSTCSPANTVSTVQEQLDNAMSIAIDEFWGRTNTQPNSFR